MLKKYSLMNAEVFLRCPPWSCIRLRSGGGTTWPQRVRGVCALGCCRSSPFVPTLLSSPCPHSSPRDSSCLHTASGPGRHLLLSLCEAFSRPCTGSFCSEHMGANSSISPTLWHLRESLFPSQADTSVLLLCLREERTPEAGLFQGCKDKTCTPIGS